MGRAGVGENIPETARKVLSAIRKRPLLPRPFGTYNWMIRIRLCIISVNADLCASDLRNMSRNIHPRSAYTSRFTHAPSPSMGTIPINGRRVPPRKTPVTLASVCAQIDNLPQGLSLIMVSKVAPAVLVRTLAECHEKSLDIGSGHNTQTAWSSMRESNDPKEERIKNM